MLTMPHPPFGLLKQMDLEHASCPHILKNSNTGRRKRKRAYGGWWCVECLKEERCIRNEFRFQTWLTLTPRAWEYEFDGKSWDYVTGMIKDRTIPIPKEYFDGPGQ